MPPSRPSSRPTSFFHCGEILISSRRATDTSELASLYQQAVPRPEYPNENDDENNGDNDDGDAKTASVGEEEKKEEVSCIKTNIAKYGKILIPHIILITVLIGYLCLGAWILMNLETETELNSRSRKLIKLRKNYKRSFRFIAFEYFTAYKGTLWSCRGHMRRVTNLMVNFTEESWRMINGAQHGRITIDKQVWSDLFRYKYMLKISETVDDRRPIRKELAIPDDLSNMHNKWTFPTSLLYVLTVLTTCGYGEVSVDTDSGKVFSVAFAFLGIPLMFITAADIGKFLSETLLTFVSQWNKMCRRIKSAFFYSVYGRRLSIPSSTGNTEMLDIFGIDEADEKLWFPIGAYVGCISMYCAVGSFMFIFWERNWSFLHAFHFGFNLIVTVGLGDVVVTDYIFLSLIVAFVIVGLSVMTMCVDLASTHLKAYFTRIHYFGRAKRFLGMSEELKEIVALLGAMRRKKGGKVSWNDIVDFLTNELRDRPFEPRQLLKRLKFIDDTNHGMSTIRYNSLQDFLRESIIIRRLHEKSKRMIDPVHV